MEQDSTEVAISYLSVFSNYVEQLTSEFGIYANTINQARFKYAGEKFEEQVKRMDDTDKETILTRVQQVQFLVNQTFIKYRSLAKVFPSLKKDSAQLKEIEAVHLKILDSPVPTVKDVKDYAQLMNDVIVVGISTDFFTNTKEMMANLNNG